MILSVCRGCFKSRCRAGASHQNSDEQPLPEVLAVLYNEFEQVHPFLDGKGRTGRLVLNLILVRLRYPPIVVMKQQRPTYLAAMQRADEGDPGLLGELLARAMLDNLNRFILPNVAGPPPWCPLRRWWTTGSPLPPSGRPHSVGASRPTRARTASGAAHAGRSTTTPAPRDGEPRRRIHEPLRFRPVEPEGHTLRLLTDGVFPVGRPRSRVLQQPPGDRAAGRSPVRRAGPDGAVHNELAARVDVAIKAKVGIRIDGKLNGSGASVTLPPTRRSRQPRLPWRSCPSRCLAQVAGCLTSATPP